MPIGLHVLIGDKVLNDDDKFNEASKELISSQVGNKNYMHHGRGGVGRGAYGFWCGISICLTFSCADLGGFEPNVIGVALVTHMRNKNSNIQGMSPNVVKVIFRAIRNHS